MVDISIAKIAAGEFTTGVNCGIPHQTSAFKIKIRVTEVITHVKFSKV